MSKLLTLFLMLAFAGIAQVDTIYATDGRTIACKILKERSDRIKYRVYGQWDSWMSISEIRHYSNHNEKTTKPTRPGKAQINTRKEDTLTGLAAEVRNNTRTIEHMQYNLRRSHEQFNSGLILMGVGIGIAALSTIANDNEQLQLVMVGAASGFGW